MWPVRISFVTYNLWNTKRWPERRPALEQFLTRFCPDVLCTQELRPEIQSCIDETLPRHERVHDDLPGWTVESNIYWNSDMMRQLEHGAEDVGILEEHRRLFWVRLELVAERRTVWVGTAHYTYQGHPKERETGWSPRVEQTRRTVQALQSLVREGEPAFFMGDLNDPVHPMAILHEAGYQSCFAALGLLPPPTHPCVPTASIPPGQRVTNQTIDWLVANRYARPIAAQVPHTYYGDIAPSDHWPILAVYEV